MLFMAGTSRTSARNGKTVSGPRTTCRPSVGVGFADAASAPGSTGIPRLTRVTTVLRNEPSAMSQAPGMARFTTATRATTMRPEIDAVRASTPRKGATNRTITPASRPGHNFRLNRSRLRQSPPVARPRTMPATRPLTSMGIASHRLARQAFAEFGQGLVVNRRQFAYLERLGTPFLEEGVERANDLGIELNSLVPVELIHRAFVANR